MRHTSLRLEESSHRDDRSHARVEWLRVAGHLEVSGIVAQALKGVGRVELVAIPVRDRQRGLVFVERLAAERRDFKDPDVAESTGRPLRAGNGEEQVEVVRAKFRLTDDL